MCGRAGIGVCVCVCVCVCVRARVCEYADKHMVAVCRL